MTELPKIGKAATQALNFIGIHHLEAVSKIDKVNLMKLHGVGPKAIKNLQEALDDIDLNFADPVELPFNSPFAILGSLGCDNAPKRRQIRDFIISRTLSDLVGMQEEVIEQAEFEYLSDRSYSLEELIDHINFKPAEIFSLQLEMLLSHGKEGSALSIISLKNGQQIWQADFFEFSSHSKSAKIKSVQTLLK